MKKTVKTVILSGVIILFSLSGMSKQSVVSNENSFDRSILIQEKDPQLNIEAWMLDSKLWEEDSLPVATDRDKNLELESWMIDNPLWQK